MPYGKEIYVQARRELQRRRTQAEREAQRRHEEVAGRYPELTRIEQEMAQVGCSIVYALGRPDAEAFVEGLHRQSKKAQHERRELLKAAGLPENYLEPPYVCPACGDTGFVEGQICSCHKRLLRSLAYQQINRRYPLDLCTFESFRLEYYPEEADSRTGLSPRRRMAEIFEFCLHYAEDFGPHSPSLFLCGATGLGKTHLSLSIAREAIAKDFAVIYGSTQNLLHDLEEEHFGRGGTAGGDTQELLLTCDLLILDDLGAEFSTQFTVAALYNIINSRINAGLPVIISTNLTPGELEGKYTQRITSRIIGCYTSLIFCGRDIRQLRR
ncbi:MAG TPA: ATP-binding protein [Candidatus Fimivicinus intestinavium]|nr:ATP-binding protein [Candidatus Fimivicinus intestinavium]